MEVYNKDAYKIKPVWFGSSVGEGWKNWEPRVMYRKKLPVPVSYGSTDDCCDCDDCCCFPSNGKVITRQGQVNIRDVKSGDEVLCVNHKGELTFSQVYVLTHDDPDSTMTVVSLTTESGTKLRVSPGHYLHTLAEDDSPTFTLAGQVKEGDRVLAGWQAGKMAVPERVVAVAEEEAQGRHSLLTMEGNQVVDGLVASCFEEHAHPSVAQPLLAPLRLAYRWLPLASAALNYKWSLGIPAWALLARRYVAPLLPTQL